jgi:osmotically-inducible protein OsmY
MSIPRRETRRFYRASAEAPETRRDRDLAQRLMHMLDEDMAASRIRGIHVYVRRNAVRLYGAVSSTLDRDLIISLVRSQPGVQEVRSELTVTGAPRRS